MVAEFGRVPKKHCRKKKKKKRETPEMCFVGVMSRFNNSFRKYEKVLSFGGEKGRTRWLQSRDANQYQLCVKERDEEKVFRKLWNLKKETWTIQSTSNFLQTAIFKRTWFWLYVCNNLFVSTGHIWMRGGSRLVVVVGVNHRVATPYSKPWFSIYFTRNGTIIYGMNGKTWNEWLRM